MERQDKRLVGLAILATGSLIAFYFRFNYMMYYS